MSTHFAVAVLPAPPPFARRPLRLGHRWHLEIDLLHAAETMRWAQDRSYGLMISWELRSLRMVLPLAFVVQVMISSGLILGLGFLMDDITATEARFLAVGVTVVSMITLGMVMAPQLIASQKQSGAYEYLLSLPVPRTTLIAAGLTVHSVIAVPGAAVALLVASWRYDIALNVSPIVIPERLPAWLAGVHGVLPFAHAANLMRAGLTEDLAARVGSSFAVLSAWAVASWAVTAWVVGRRA